MKDKFQPGLIISVVALVVLLLIIDHADLKDVGFGEILVFTVTFFLIITAILWNMGKNFTKQTNKLENHLKPLQRRKK